MNTDADHMDDDVVDYQTWRAARPEIAAIAAHAGPRRLLGRTIAELRVGRRMTQQQLADMLDEPQAAIAQVENGTTNVDWETLSAIFDALDVASTGSGMIDACAVDLAASGHESLAAQVKALGASAGRDWLTVVEAAELANVTQVTIDDWVGRGVLVSRQETLGGCLQINRASVVHAINRRARIDQARAEIGDQESAIARMSGLDEATIERLGGV